MIYSSIPTGEGGENRPTPGREEYTQEELPEDAKTLNTGGLSLLC